MSSKQVQQEGWEKEFENKYPNAVMIYDDMHERYGQEKLLKLLRKEKQLSYEQGRKEEREKAELEKWDLGRKCYECDGKGVIPPPLK